MEIEKVILVDSGDNAIGEMEKLEAHAKGELHRAISVMVFNSGGEILLQQRAFAKYHSPGLWSNACCSHPRPGETCIGAAFRRLKEEMGFETTLSESFHFIYKTYFENGLIEHEFDHVFFGRFDGYPLINHKEVNDFKWVKPDVLFMDIENNPEIYTVWFRLMVEEATKNGWQQFYNL